MFEEILRHVAGTWLAGVGLLQAGLVLYAAALLGTLVRPRFGLWLLPLGTLAHLLGMTARGWAIGFFPLTNKMESFSTAALAVAVVTLATWRDRRLYAAPLIALAGAALAAALRFPTEITYPPPLMQTLWYPAHVPLSFLAYAVWSAAAAAAVLWFYERDATWLALLDSLTLKGFALWSLSMICGGFWGVVAWGAYFLWDVKVIWSVILWFHYATFIHLRLAPNPWSRPEMRATLAVLGFVWVLVAYVGTSFFFGRSSHSF